MPWSDVPIESAASREVTRSGHESIGRSVRRARVAAGFSQRALAVRCGVDQAVISRLENGKLQGLSWRRFGRLVGTMGSLDVEQPSRWPGSVPPDDTDDAEC